MAALRKVFAATQERRCWLHKTLDVRNALPKSVQAKAHLHDIWPAETRAAATAAFNVFVTTCAVKWEKAAIRLVKKRDSLLAVNDFRADDVGSGGMEETRRPHSSA